MTNAAKINAGTLLAERDRNVFWRNLPPYSCVREGNGGYVATWPGHRTPSQIFWHSHEAAEAQALLRRKAEAFRITEFAIKTAGKGNVHYD